MVLLIARAWMSETSATTFFPPCLIRVKFQTQLLFFSLLLKRNLNFSIRHIIMAFRSPLQMPLTICLCDRFKTSITIFSPMYGVNKMVVHLQQFSTATFWHHFILRVTSAAKNYSNINNPFKIVIISKEALKRDRWRGNLGS